jgi:pantoate kinase
LPALVGRAWAFARETGLVTERVEREVARVRGAGGEATMAMLGETVVATDVDGVLSNATRVCSSGARVL